MIFDRYRARIRGGIMSTHIRYASSSSIRRRHSVHSPPVISSNTPTRVKFFFSAHYHVFKSQVLIVTNVSDIMRPKRVNVCALMLKRLRSVYTGPAKRERAREPALVRTRRGRRPYCRAFTSPPRQMRPNVCLANSKSRAHACTAEAE